jgi:hypothetical protein
MFDWIQKNSINVHSDMGSTRILGAALKQATAEQVVNLKKDGHPVEQVVNLKRGRDEEMQEPKKALKITDRLGPSLSERLGKKESPENRKLEEISRQKCSLWPNCIK